MNTKVVTELEEQIRGDLMIPGEEEPNSIDRGDDGKITKSGETGLAIQSSNTEIVNWEVKEPVPIMVQQQQRVQDVDKANSTWTRQVENGADTKSRNSRSRVHKSLKEEDLLKRCLIGYCTAGKKEKPTGYRASPQQLKKAFGVNIYELNK
ncbi:hypothetical protein H5410_027326 [Solanum commersonii]|uniref:Uncharacterized protein n=1 Tax=Solanum commersonii TaxID=4109 RepID=A0A9J5YZK1_SOLCO|nr:hypothetical protein H5410_027326 [Solanum commersonii]